jgi:hypothetical protein
MAANISLSPRLASIYIFLPHKQFNCRTTTTTTDRATGEKFTLVLIFTRADDDRHNMEIQSNQIPYIVIETTK